jgi:hypothetical protein
VSKSDKILKGDQSHQSGAKSIVSETSTPSSGNDAILLRIDAADSLRGSYQTCYPFKKVTTFITGHFTHDTLSMEYRLSWEPSVAQLVKKFPAFCENRRLITVSNRSPSRVCPEPAESCPHFHICFLIHFNIALPSTPRSPKWSLVFRILG